MTQKLNIVTSCNLKATSWSYLFPDRAVLTESPSSISSGDSTTAFSSESSKSESRRFCLRFLCNWTRKSVMLLPGGSENYIEIKKSIKTFFLQIYPSMTFSLKQCWPMLLEYAMLEKCGDPCFNVGQRYSRDCWFWVTNFFSLRPYRNDYGN